MHGGEPSGRQDRRPDLIRATDPGSRPTGGNWNINCQETSIPDKQALTVQDGFEIFEQLNKHQRAIDAGPGKAAVDNYNSLY